MAQDVIYRFGPFRLDPRDCRVFRDGMPLALPPKVFDLLALLVSRAPTLVTKDDLLETLWRDTAVSDNTLTQTVMDLRRALGDRAEDSLYVETVPRRGYRLAVDVAISTSREGVCPEPFVADRAVPARARAGTRETPNGQAYDAFVDGRRKLERMDVEHTAGALADFERAIVLDPRYALPYVGLAHARFWMYESTRIRNRRDAGLLIAAIADAHRAIDLDPDLPEAHAALALLLSTAGRRAEAIAAGRRAVVLEPGNWRNHCRLALATWGEECLAAWTRVIELHPDFAYAHYGLAMMFLARQQMERAEEALRRGAGLQDRAGQFDARFPGRGAHWLLGLTRLAAGDAAEAGREFDRELAAGSSGVYGAEFVLNAYDGHGFARLSEGDLDGACAMFSRALAVAPGHVRSWLGSAAAHARAGRRERAADATSRAEDGIRELQDDGRLAEAALARAFHHVVGDRLSDAIRTLDELLARAPHGPAGWTIPVEPLFGILQAEAGFQHVLTRLAARAR